MGGSTKKYRGNSCCIKSGQQARHLTGRPAYSWLLSYLVLPWLLSIVIWHVYRLRIYWQISQDQF